MSGANLASLLLPWSIWAARLCCLAIALRMVVAAMAKAEKARQSIHASRQLECPICGKAVAARGLYGHLKLVHGRAAPPAAGGPPAGGAPGPAESPAAAPAAAPGPDGPPQDPPDGERCPAADDGWHDWRALNPAIPAHYKAYALGYREYCRHCELLWPDQDGAE